MTTNRINLLFPLTMPEPRRTRQLVILMATAKVIKQKAAIYRPMHVSLTDRVWASISEIKAALLTGYGTPARPNMTALYSYEDIHDTLYELHKLDFLDVHSIRAVGLTNELFKAIAEEWAYARGGTWHKVDGERIFAASIAQAQRIAAVRERNEAARKEVATV